MAYSKIKKILFILLCCIVLIFPFWCVRGLCAETESLEPSVANNIIISPNSNYFVSSSSGNTSYVSMEKGYIYYITISSDTPSGRRIAMCTDVPALNVTYDYLGTFEPGTTFSFIPSVDSYFLCYSPSNYNNVSFSREKITSQESAVNDLVNNVGINTFWSIFDISINYIVVVVLFAFGVFIIFKIIRKISKGKEGL